MASVKVANTGNTTDISEYTVVRDVADRFGGWQQLTIYRDPESKSGALGGDIHNSDILPALEMLL